MSVTLACWKCGASLESVPLPFPRLAECPACETDLHVCRMCRLYDTGVADSCREPVAERVTDKERANFCGYFDPSPDAHRGAGSTAAPAERAALSALFGIEPGEKTPEADPGDELKRLFGLDGEEEPRSE